MCQQTDCFHLGCQHRFASPGPSSSITSPSSPTNSMSMPPAFQYCPTLIEHRAKTHKLNFIARLFHDHYAPCQNFCLETRVVKGVCPTCEWQIKEGERLRSMSLRGEVQKKTLGLVRSDDWDESMD